MIEVMGWNDFTIVHSEWSETKFASVKNAIENAKDIEKEKRRITIKEIISTWDLDVVIYQNELVSKKSWEQEKYLEAFVFNNKWKAIFSIYIDAE